MEKWMQPFIMVYHFVKTVFYLPRRILHYAYNGFLTTWDTLTNKKAQDAKEAEIKRAQEEIMKNLAPTNKEKVVSKKDEPPLLSFRYTAKGHNGKVIKGTFDAVTKTDAMTFLTSEGYEILTLELRNKFDIDLFANRQMNTADLSFSLTQLSTYIKAGIPLIDSVRILAHQTPKPELRKTFERIVYELLGGENFSTALDKQGKVFPNLLVNMVKTAEKTGDLPTILDDMADYYDSMAKTKKQMVSALTYPTVIFVIAIAVVVFMLTNVVPSFVEMFKSQDAEIPTITKMVMGASSFVVDNYMWVLIALIVILVVYHQLYTTIKSFRKTMQTIYMHLPVIGKILIYNEVFNFTKTFSSLINHGVYITESMEILSQITSNEVYKDIITKTLANLSTGAKISDAFKGEWAFPVAAYEMLVTGENTGQLGLMMEKVSEYYQSLHKSMVDQLKSLVEPIMICFLAIMVGIIVLSIVVPMFGIYGTIQ